MKNTIDFDNTQIAFSLKSKFDLIQANLLFTLIGKRWLTAIAKPVTNFLFTIGFPIGPILKKTVFKQFCGGESIAECQPIIDLLYLKKGVFSILDYSVEGKESEEQFDNSVTTTLNALDFAKISKATPFLVFKATGLGRFALLEKVSNHEKLTAQEFEEWKRVVNRLDKICSSCASIKNVKVMIDAEESWIQNAIDLLIERMMIKYNTQEVIVFNSVQLYRWDRLAYLERLLNLSLENNCRIGVKLVRGAYMEKERARAIEKGYTSPICIDKKTSDINFDNGLHFCLEHLNKFELFLGTHNEQSSQQLISLMKANHVANNDPRVWFGQLYGMGDHISFNLSKENYNTAKYLPFGPIREVMPYLLRRAEENTSVGTQTSRELQLLKKELKRRSQKK